MQRLLVLPSYERQIRPSMRTKNCKRALEKKGLVDCNRSQEHLGKTKLLWRDELRKISLTYVANVMWQDGEGMNLGPASKSNVTLAVTSVCMSLWELRSHFPQLLYLLDQQVCCEKEFSAECKAIIGYHHGMHMCLCLAFSSALLCKHYESRSWQHC